MNVAMLGSAWYVLIAEVLPTVAKYEKVLTLFSVGGRGRGAGAPSDGFYAIVPEVLRTES